MRFAFVHISSFGSCVAFRRVGHRVAFLVHLVLVVLLSYFTVWLIVTVVVQDAKLTARLKSARMMMIPSIPINSTLSLWSSVCKCFTLWLVGSESY